MKIGIIGEDPYDTIAIKNLLSRRYPYRFKPILRHIKGDQLNSAKTKRLLKIELKDAAYAVVIFTRDLDGLETETQKIQDITKWFEDLDFTNTGILLLHIYELEALILADISTFNRLFDTRLNFTGNPMYQKEPKEYLKERTRKCRRKFDVSENPVIFKYLRIEELIRNCLYFKDFIKAFDDRISSSIG